MTAPRRSAARRAGAGSPVLVVSGPQDGHARAVLAELARRRVPAEVVDTARFPGRLAVALRLDGGAGWRGALRDSGRPLDPRGGTVWWRRPEPYRLHPAFAGPRRDGAYCAADAALSAWWRSLDVRWVNDLDRELAADDKPLQLALAARVGLAVPRSCITNDPGAARAFVLERPEGGTIHKNVVAARALGRTTAVARAGDRALFASVRRLPLLFQERVPAAADVRATLVGDEVFAAEIDFPGGRPALDWRPALRRARVRPVRLPSGVEAGLRRLVRELGLVYGAVDLRRRPDGEHVFLEVNPSGQWLFVERRTRQPITAAVAAALARR